MAKRISVKVHPNIYDTGTSFCVRFNRNGVKRNESFSYDPNILWVDKNQPPPTGGREIALNHAIAYRTAEWGEITRKGTSIVNTSQLTVRNLLTLYLEQETPKKKGATEEKYRTEKILVEAVYKKVLDTPIIKLKVNDFTALIEALKTIYKPYTINRILSIFSNAFKFAKENHDTAWVQNLAAGLSIPIKQDRKLVSSRDDLLLIASHSESPLFQLALLLGIETGARRSEIARLHYDDVILKGKAPHIIFRDLKNGEAEKIVPLSPQMQSIFNGVSEKDRVGFVFKHAKNPNQPMDKHSLSTAFSRARTRAVAAHPEKKLHLEQARFHASRGRFITDKAKIVNPLTLSALSGHKDINVLTRANSSTPSTSWPGYCLLSSSR